MANGQERAVLIDAGIAAGAAGHPRPAPRRRFSFCRFSVRGLLLLILAIGCGLGWMAWILRTGQVQRRAVAAIYQAGGWVVYDTEWEQGQSGPAWKPVWPKWLVDRVGVDYAGKVVFVNLHDRGTDALLAHLARLTRLRQLHRLGSSVTDAGVGQLGRLSDLQLLSLDDTQVTDAGLSSLKGLSGLKWLKLARTKVTKNGVEALQKSLPLLTPIH